MNPIIKYPACGTGTSSVLLHPFSPQWLIVNSSAYSIACELLKDESLERVALKIGQKYGISYDKAKNDVASAKQALDSAGFLPFKSFKPQKRVPQPKSLYLHLTQRCNLSCPHCYIGKQHNSTSADLPIKRVLELIEELKAMGGQSVTLSGGEPLLYPHLERIIKNASADLQIRLLSNGTLMDHHWATRMAKNGVYVQISVDGSKSSIHDTIRGKGNFQRAIKALNFLKAAGLSNRINISTTIMQYNLRDLPRIIELAEQLGVPLVRFLPLRKKGAAVRNWDEIGVGLTQKDSENFYDFVLHSNEDRESQMAVSCGLSGFILKMSEDEPDQIWCPMGTQPAIDVDGSVYPCSALMIPEFRIGNVFKQSLENIFCSGPMQRVCEILVMRRSKIDRCAICNWRNLCQSGCMAMALEHKGTIWDTDDFCEYRKKLYRKAFDRILAHQDKAAIRNG